MRRFTTHLVSLDQVNAGIARWHRHSGRLLACLDAVELRERGRACGIGALGLPLARLLDDGVTLEVRRTATDGTDHACSAVLGALARAAGRRGALRLVTYTREGESGSSLRGAGWRLDEAFHAAFAIEEHERGARIVRTLAAKPARSWSCPSRPRAARELGTGRFRWWRLLPPACTFDGALALGAAAARAGQVTGNPFPLDGLHSGWWSIWRDGFDYPGAAEPHASLPSRRRDHVSPVD